MSLLYERRYASDVIVTCYEDICRPLQIECSITDYQVRRVSLYGLVYRADFGTEGLEPVYVVSFSFGFLPV